MIFQKLQGPQNLFYYNFEQLGMPTRKITPLYSYPKIKMHKIVVIKNNI